MGVREPSTPQFGSTRPVVVASFYAALLVAGFFWHAVAQDSNNVWAEAGTSRFELLWTPMLGLVFGLVTVQMFRGLELRMRWLSELHREFRAIFGQPRGGEILLLATASALGEEIFFRGAMLDAWGLWISSVVFALLHIPSRAALWPWTASSLVLGVLLGWMTLETGNLGPAVVAHFVINLLNLAYITRHPPRMPLRGPIKPR